MTDTITVTGSLSDVNEKYEILHVLGSGSYGTVRKCRHRESGEEFAVKTILKANVDDIKVLLREISILASLNHPHIIKLYDVYEDSDSIHIVTELCTGGELYDRVCEKAESPEGHFHEHDAAILIRDILDAISYCHDVAKIVHRDLKPENFLLKDERDDAPIKIIDFGLSRKDDADFGIMSSRVGTPYYVAPEVLADSYNYKCDIWSIGVIAYILLCGFAPFSGDTDMETLYLVETADLGFPSPEWDDISDEAKDFIRQLLQRDAYLRPTAAEAMKHPWIAKHVVPPGLPKPRPFSQISSSGTTDDGSAILSNSSGSVELKMDSSRKSAFQKFLVSLKLKKALGSISEELTPEEMNTLGDVFRQVDQDKDGLIGVEDIDFAIAKSDKYYAPSTTAGSNNANSIDNDDDDDDDEDGNIGSTKFSESLRSNLQQMRSTLASYPKMSINVKPFLKLVERTMTLPKNNKKSKKSES